MWRDFITQKMCNKMESNSICAVFTETERELILESIQARIAYYTSKIKNYTGGPASEKLQEYIDKKYHLEQALRMWVIESN
jgi:hypothetical protein